MRLITLPSDAFIIQLLIFKILKTLLTFFATAVRVSSIHVYADQQEKPPINLQLRSLKSTIIVPLHYISRPA